MESTWSAAVVLLITPVIDPSLSRNPDPSLQIVYQILDEMTAVGNHVAACRRVELEQLASTLAGLEAMNRSNPHLDSGAPEQDLTTQIGSMPSEADMTSSLYSGCDDTLNSQQLEAVAESLNLTEPAWSWVTSSMELFGGSSLE